MTIIAKTPLSLRLGLVAAGCAAFAAFSSQASVKHGLIGLRPLPRTAEMDQGHNHGGSWAGTPTYEEQKGKYPFVAEHIDVVKGWLGGDFKTRRMFFEYYWGLSEERDWLKTYWEAGLPKHNPNMHYYLNLFPHASGRKRPMGQGDCAMMGSLA